MSQSFSDEAGAWVLAYRGSIDSTALLLAFDAGRRCASKGALTNREGVNLSTAKEIEKIICRFETGAGWWWVDVPALACILSDYEDRLATLEERYLAGEAELRNQVAVLLAGKENDHDRPEAREADQG